MMNELLLIGTIGLFMTMPVIGIYVIIKERRSSLEIKNKNANKKN